MQISRLSFMTPAFASSSTAPKSKRTVVELPPYEGKNYNNTHFITTDYGEDGQVTRVAMRRRDLNDEIIEYLPDGSKRIITGEMLNSVPSEDEVKFLFEPSCVKYFDKENKTKEFFQRDCTGNFDYYKKGHSLKTLSIPNDLNQISYHNNSDELSIGLEGEVKKGDYSLQQLRKLQAEMLYTLCAIEEEGMIDSKKSEIAREAIKNMA